MRIAFFGSYLSFDYYHIGGTNSIARRLGHELILLGEEVSFIHFGAPVERFRRLRGIRICHFSTFEDSLQFLAGVFDHVVVIYIPIRNRPAFAHFRRREEHRTRFHFLYTSWPEPWIKRELSLFEQHLSPYNGWLFCVSPRQFEHLSGRFGLVRLLFPPVPEDYFLRLKDKSHHPLLRVVYIGRLDRGKGTLEAKSFFEYIQARTGFETYIYGYPWQHKPETMQLHESLLSQENIPYQPAIFNQYTPEIDDCIRTILRETDILFLPYRELSSTIDTPLLLLEGMASLCPVITRNLGSLAEVYGTSRWMVDDLSHHERLLHVVQDVDDKLMEERARLEKRNRELEFGTRSIANQFLSALQSA